MGDFKILMSVTMATLLLLLQGCTLVISRPPGSTGGAEKDVFSKDYNALQNILGKHLAGTSTEKSKVIDLLLQLLEEIDLPTLCEVIINDTKGSNQASLRVPIKYTKIDVDLLNSLDHQMAMENPGNEATLQPPSKMAMGADISTSAESHEQMAIKDNGEESSDHQDGTKDNNHTPATYKYHTDELNNGDRISNQERQYAKDDSFNNGNYPEELSSSTLSSGDSKENPGNDISSQDLLTDGQVLYSSLLKPNTAPDADDGNTMKVIGDLKQMYLTSRNNHGAEDNDVLSGYTNDINNKNILVKQIDVERPRAQLFSHSLVLGDWTNKNRFDRNFLTTYTDNEAELRAMYAPHQNNVVASDAWSDNVKSEYKTRFSPTKQQQQKYARGYLDSHDNVGQMISPEISTLPNTLATYDPTDASRPITPLENQRQVDYLEELRSTLMAKEPNKNIPTLVKDADTSHKDSMASMTMFSQMKTNFANVESENAVFDSDSNEVATDKQQIKMLVDYSNVKELRDNNNVINQIDNNGFPQEMANWIDASHFIPESGSTGKSDALPYGEQGVTDAITNETSPQPHLTTPSTSFIATEPQAQLLLSETDNQTANPSSTQSSQNPNEMATPATALFSTTIDTEILTGNFDVTQTTASTVQEQAINETAEQSSSFGLPQHTSASNLPRWAQSLYTNSSSTDRTHDPDAVPEETKLGSLNDNVVLNNEQVKDEPSTTVLDSQTAQSTVTYTVNALTNESTSMDYPQTAQSTVTYSVNALINESTSMDYPQTAQSTVTYSVSALINESTSMDYPQTAQSTVTYSVNALINESTSMDYPQMEAHMKVANPGVISASDVETINVTQGRMTGDDNATHAWVANNNVRPAGVGNNEVTQAGVINSYGTHAGVTNSDFTQTGVSNNEVTQAGITTSDVTQLEFTYNNATQAGVTNNNITQAGVTDNNVTQTGVTNSDVTQAGVINSDATQAGVTNSYVTQAGVTNNDVTQAGVTHSDVTQAGVINSDVTQAGVTNSDVTQAGVTNNDVTQTGVINSDITQAEFTNNNVTQAGITNSDVTQATVTNSDVTQTGVSNNEVTQVGVTISDVTQSGVTNSDVTQTGVSNNEATQAGITISDVTQTKVSSNEVTQTEVSNNEVTQAGVTYNDVTQARVRNNNVTQTLISNNEVTQVGVTNSNVTQATVTNNNVTQTEVSNNEVTQAGVTNSDVTQVGVTNSDVTQAGVTNSDVTQATVTNNNVTQTEVSNNEVTQAGVTNGEVTQVGVTNSDVTHAGVTNSDVTQATVTNNNITQTEVSNNEVTQAGVTNSDVTQAGVTNSDVTQAGVTNSDVTQAGVTNSDVTQARVTNSDVTQARVTNSDVTQATVTNNNVTQTEVRNNEVTQAGVTSSDAINAYITDNIPDAGVTNSDVSHDDLTNNHTTPMNFTTIATQQSSVFDATTTDQIQHTSPVTTTTTTAQESYLPFSQTRNPSVLISMTTTNDVVIEAVSKSNVTTSTTDENSLPITNSSEVVEEESSLQKKQRENKTASIVNVKDITRNISNNVEADSGDVVMNTSSQTNIWLSADRNVLGEDVSQNTSYVSAYTTESGILGDVNNVSATTGHNVEEDVTVNTTIESNVSATGSTGADISASPEVTSLFTSTHAPVMISTVSNTLEPEVQSYPPVVDTDASLSMMNLSNDVLTSQNLMSVSENLTLVQSLNEILGSANTTEEAINTTTTVSSTAFNSELPASTQMDPTGLDVNTTVTATTDNITVDTTENNFNAAPKFVLEKTADFDNFIQPTIIDYGSNRMDGSTLEISIKQQSSKTSSEEPTSSTSSVIVQNNTVTGVQRTDNEVKETYNLTDTEATYNLADTEETYNLADTEGTYNLTDTEENTTSFTSQATISFLATSLNESEAKTANVDVIEPVTLGTSAKTGTLSQVLRGNITTDNLKIISSKIAKTKANLSRINMDLLKPLQIRIPYEDSTSETTANTETVSMGKDKNISSAKNETSEQQATITPESTNTGSPDNDISTELTYVVTTANPIEYTITKSTTSTPTVTDAAPSIEIITPAFKSSISSVKTMSSSITIPSDSIHETSAPSSAGSSYKPDDLKDFTQNILDGYSGSFEYSNIPKSDYLSGEDKTQFSSTSVPQSGNWAKVYDFPYLPRNGKYPNKPSNRPYMSQFSDHAGQTQPRTKPVLDSWKVYNIAVGKAKTNVNTQDIIDQSGVPEIHLFSNYRYTPAPVDNLRNYLWQARPWPKNAVENLDQGATYNRMVASKPELYQNQNMDMSKSVNYQTKALNKIDSHRDQVKKIGNANVWGNRFSQGYYGRVFDDQSSGLNTDDSTTWPTFHSRDMVNFDTLGGDNLKYFKGYNQVQSINNKRNNFNGNLRMQSSHSFDLNQRYRDLMKTFPQYHNAELDQETPSNEQQSRTGTQPDYAAAWNEDSSADEAQTETATVPETEVTGFRTTDTSTHYNGVPAPEDYTCPGLFGYHKDPKNCQAFFICSWGMAHRVVCPPGTLYNSKEAVCDWAVNIRCTVTPDNSKTLNV